jgi:uncharacterized protein
VIKIKDRRAIELDELKIRYDSLVQHNKILLSGYLQHFHPLTRFIDSERLRRRLKISSSNRNSIMEEEYYNTIDALLSEDCVKQMQMYIQHGDTTTYTHCLAVSYYSYQISRHLPMHIDIRSITRGALLHDLFLYDWHIPDESHRLHGFYHPGIAFENASRYFQLNRKEADIILKHMWPLTVTRVPRCREALLVCLVDKFCSFFETIGLSYKRQFVFERIDE